MPHSRMVHIEERKGVEIVQPHGERDVIKEAAEDILSLRKKLFCLLLLHGNLPPFYSVPGCNSLPMCQALPI
jgi:hypothetical protein